jgi:hypothetical protein
MIGDAANFSSAGRTHWGWIIAVTLLLVFLPAGFDTHTPTLLGIWSGCLHLCHHSDEPW